MTSKITLRIVRSFGIGFTIYAPALNGICFEINFLCFSLLIWNRGAKWFGFKIHWFG